MEAILCRTSSASGWKSRINVGYDICASFFDETNDGLHVPRNLSVDLEPNVIDDTE